MNIIDFVNTENAVLERKGKAPYISFPALSKISFVKHGFSTRLGGVSKGHLSSMNLDFTRDGHNAVLKNFKIICESIGLNYRDLVFSHQVHKTEIRTVTEDDKGSGIVRPRDYSEIDGLITNIPGIPLVTFYADCVPLYFVDKKNQAIGLSHSGWRGTVGKIGEKTITAMYENYGTDPKDLVAVIGPSISQDAYEVSADVANEFKDIFTNEQLEDIIEEKENGKYQLDLWQANYHILLEAGVVEENIHISGVCTASNSDLLFSHRASDGKRGSLAAFLMINDIEL